MYDFNNARDLILKGEDPEDICKAFAAMINAALEEKKTMARRDEIYTKLCNAWNIAMDYYCDMHDIDNAIYLSDADEVEKMFAANMAKETYNYDKVLGSFLHELGL